MHSPSTLYSNATAIKSLLCATALTPRWPRIRRNNITITRLYDYSIHRRDGGHRAGFSWWESRSQLTL